MLLMKISKSLSRCRETRTMSDTVQSLHNGSHTFMRKGAFLWD